MPGCGLKFRDRWFHTRHTPPSAPTSGGKDPTAENPKASSTVQTGKGGPWPGFALRTLPRRKEGRKRERAREREKETERALYSQQSPGERKRVHWERKGMSSARTFQKRAKERAWVRTSAGGSAFHALRTADSMQTTSSGATAHDWNMWPGWLTRRQRLDSKNLWVKPSGLD